MKFVFAVLLLAGLALAEPESTPEADPEAEAAAYYGGYYGRGYGYGGYGYGGYGGHRYSGYYGSPDTDMVDMVDTEASVMLKPKLTPPSWPQALP